MASSREEPMNKLRRTGGTAPGALPCPPPETSDLGSPPPPVLMTGHGPPRNTHRTLTTTSSPPDECVDSDSAPLPSEEVTPSKLLYAQNFLVWGAKPRCAGVDGSLLLDLHLYLGFASCILTFALVLMQNSCRALNVKQIPSRPFELIVLWGKKHEGKNEKRGGRRCE